MKSYILLAYLICLCGLLATSVFAGGEDHTWQPVTPEDWEVREDSAAGIHHAVMLFEKIIADDRKMSKDKCYLSVYYRIRIFSQEGRKWGDVIVPVLNKKQKIEKIYGRTLLPDGQEIPLNELQIFEKEVLKGKGFKVKQKSFSLPGVTDDCIVEYYIEYRLPHHYSLWLIQKEIFLKEGEYLWKVRKEISSGEKLLQILGFDNYTPNYLLRNTGENLIAEKRPLKDPDEVLFKINNIPAFEEEPYTMPDIALKVLLQSYYGGNESSSAYWGMISKNIQTWLYEITAKDDQVREVVEQFSGLETPQEKTKAAYTWLQQNIKNTDYDESDEKFKDNKTVNDVLKRGYGTEEDINITFYDMLREMNIDAKMLYTIDRDDNFFSHHAKYWQFNRSLVAVLVAAGEDEFYSPGQPLLPFGELPWYNENTMSLLVGDPINQFIMIPPSSSRANRINRHQVLNLGEDLQLRGQLSERHSGQSARTIRLALYKATAEEKSNFLQEQFSEMFLHSKADSFVVENLDSLESGLKVQCQVTVASAGQLMGDRLLIKPYMFFSSNEKPFSARQRKFIMVFDYAKDIMETLQINLPPDLQVEALPPDTSFSNTVGSCQIALKNYGNRLSVQRLFRLEKPIWDTQYYSKVQQLFQTQQVFEEMTIVLKKKNSYQVDTK